MDEKITRPKQFTAQATQITQNTLLGRLPPELLALVITYHPSQIGRVRKEYKFLYKFCGTGTEPGKAIRPWGMGINQEGNLVVAEYSTDRIQIFDVKGTSLKIFGTTETSTAMGLVIKNNGDIVTEYTRHQVLVFNSKGTLIQTIGSPGSLEGHFDYPTDLMLDQDENLHVTDVGGRLQIFKPDGTFDRVFPAADEKFHPRGCALDQNGNVTMVDQNANRVSVFNPEGQLLRSFGTRGPTQGAFENPLAIKLDVDGNILVVDHGNDRIQIFDSTGIFLTLFGPNDPKHKLKAPVSLLLDPDGQIFVADEENNITVWG